MDIEVQFICRTLVERAPTFALLRASTSCEVTMPVTVAMGGGSFNSNVCPAHMLNAMKYGPRLGAMALTVAEEAMIWRGKWRGILVQVGAIPRGTAIRTQAFLNFRRVCGFPWLPPETSAVLPPIDDRAFPHRFFSASPET